MNKSRMPRSKSLAWIVVVVVAAVAIGGIPSTRHAVRDFFGLAAQTTDADSYYTCPMHPEIRLPQMGDCPICGMSLVKKTRGEEIQTGTISVTTQQIQLAGVTTEPVRRRELSRQITAFGKVDYDETRLAVVSAWVGGRIDKLYVDFTGVTVDKGHPLVKLYSPDLISTQNEYLLAIDNLENLRAGGHEDAIHSAEDMVHSARQRLLRWGLSEEQLERVEQTRTVEDHVTIYAPLGGTVIQKNAYEGMYVREGDVLFRLADLSTVWVDVEVYEDDIPFLYQKRAGDYYRCPMHHQVTSTKPGTCRICGMELVRVNDSVVVNIQARAFPGEEFQGVISFTDPFLDPETRTVRIRVDVDNSDQKLKPNMYARANIHLPVGDLLAVPENAVILSGSRNIVLVEEGPGRFRPQPVRLGRMWLDDGQRANEERSSLVFKQESLRYHEVLAGLREGEVVVTSGNFLLGSESQLQGALSKMLGSESGEAGEEPADSLADHHFAREERLDKILNAYYAIGKALTRDETDGIPAQAGKIVDAAANELIRKAAEPLRRAHDKKDIEAARDDFHALSDALIAYVGSRKSQMEHLPLLAYCPMKDANWLQAANSDELLNPYYGSKMLYCGSFKTWK
jgi:Cu(I)/Ag(I) efflux system membrane fusion protein